MLMMTMIKCTRTPVVKTICFILFEQAQYHDMIMKLCPHVCPGKITHLIYDWRVYVNALE